MAILEDLFVIKIEFIPETLPVSNKPQVRHNDNKQKQIKQ